jgi:exonuclease VII large subunit
MSRDNDPRRVFSVSQLNEESRRLLEGALPSVWVEGEI